MPKISRSGPSSRDPSFRRSLRARRTLLAVMYPLLSLALALTTWKVAKIVFDPPTYILPSPEEVAKALSVHWALILENLFVTLEEIIYGLLLAIATAIPIAFLMASSVFLERLLYPLLIAFEGLPKSALAPLFIVWFGYGLLPKVLLVLAISFLPILVSTFVGLTSVSNDTIDMGRLMGLKRLGLLRRIQLPRALPSFFGGLKVAVGLAIVGAIVAEFMGAQAGIGNLLLIASVQIKTDLVFASLFVIGCTGLSLYFIVDAVERTIVPWHRQDRYTKRM